MEGGVDDVREVGKTSMGRPTAKQDKRAWKIIPVTHVLPRPKKIGDD